MEESHICVNLRGFSISKRIQAIHDFNTLLKSEDGLPFLLENQRKIFNNICRCLADENVSLCHPTMQLISRLADVFQDLPTYFSLILPSLINQLGHPKSSIRRTAVGALVHIVEQFHNVNVLGEYLIRHGFSNSSAKVRQGSILVVSQLCDIEPDLELDSVLPALVDRLSDSSFSVRESSEQVIIYLRKKCPQYQDAVKLINPRVLQTLKYKFQSNSIFYDSEGSGHIGFTNPLSSRKSTRDSLHRVPRSSRSRYPVRSQSETPDLSSVLSHTSYGTPRTPNFGPSSSVSHDPPKRRNKPQHLPSSSLDSFSLTAKSLSTRSKRPPQISDLDVDLERHLDDIIRDPGTPGIPLSVNSLQSEPIPIKDTQIKDDFLDQFIDQAPVSPQKMKYCTSNAQLIPAGHPNNFIDADAREGSIQLSTAPNNQRKPEVTFTQRPATEKSVTRKHMASKLKSLKRKKRATSAQNEQEIESSVIYRYQRKAPLPRRVKSEEHPRRTRIRNRGSDVLSAPTSGTCDLLPIPHDPEDEIQAALRGIRSEHWKQNFDALNSIRRLTQSHSSFLFPHLHTLVPVIAKSLNSLRSSLSRAAIITCKDLFNSLGKELDPHLEDLVPPLIKRAGEISNEFLCKEANEALEAMIMKNSPQKTVLVLLHQSTSKSPTVRAKVADFLASLVAQYGSEVIRSRYYGRIIKKIGDFLSEGKISIRTSAKLLLFRIVNVHDSHSVFFTSVKPFLSSSQFQKVHQIVEKGPDQETSVVPSPHKRSRSDSVHEKSHAPIASSSYEMRNHEDPLRKISLQLMSNNWTERIEALDSVLSLICESDSYTNHIFTIIDIIEKSLLDSNIKVQIQACRCMQKLLKRNPNCSLISRNIHVLVEPLSSALASSNGNLRKEAQSLFKVMISSLDSQSLLEPMGRILTFGNTRMKAHLLPRFIDLIQEGRLSETLLCKYALPVALRNLEADKSELRALNGELLQLLYMIAGPKMLKHQSITNISPHSFRKLTVLLNL